MQAQAQMFSTDSAHLASIMRKRAIKMKIIVGLIVLAIILYIIVPIVAKN